MNTRIKIICFMVFMLGWVVATDITAQTNVNCSSINPKDQTIAAPPSQGEPAIPTRDEVYSVPRKQVLLEGFTNLG